MILPTSTNPNPISSIPLNASACLSNPAARPIGLLKVLPHTDVFYREICRHNDVHVSSDALYGSRD